MGTQYHQRRKSNAKYMYIYYIVHDAGKRALVGGEKYQDAPPSE